jgi:hypothetical protein
LASNPDILPPTTTDSHKPWFPARLIQSASPRAPNWRSIFFSLPISMLLIILTVLSPKRQGQYPTQTLDTLLCLLRASHLKRARSTSLIGVVSHKARPPSQLTLLTSIQAIPILAELATLRPIHSSFQLLNTITHHDTSRIITSNLILKRAPRHPNHRTSQHHGGTSVFASQSTRGPDQ